MLLPVGFLTLSLFIIGEETISLEGTSLEKELNIFKLSSKIAVLQILDTVRCYDCHT